MALLRHYVQRPLTNVAGQLTVCVLVARNEKRLDEEVFNAPPQPLDDERTRVGIGSPEPATA